VGGREYVQVGHVTLELRRLLTAKIIPRHPDLAGFPEDIVVDVGDVLGVPYLVAHVAEKANQYIKVYITERVAEMGRIVGGDAADIETDQGARKEVI
jgi:hypothetical protein